MGSKATPNNSRRSLAAYDQGVNKRTPIFVPSEPKVDSQHLQQLRPHNDNFTSTYYEVDSESKVLIKRRLRVGGPHIMSTTTRQSSQISDSESGVNFEFDWED
eukprot:509245-Prorocentrum_minimum.AAC.1